jgi:hypothetical protein
MSRPIHAKASGPSTKCLAHYKSICQNTNKMPPQNMYSWEWSFLTTSNTLARPKGTKSLGLTKDSRIICLLLCKGCILRVSKLPQQSPWNTHSCVSLDSKKCKSTTQTSKSMQAYAAPTHSHATKVSVWCMKQFWLYVLKESDDVKRYEHENTLQCLHFIRINKDRNHPNS